MKIHYEDIYPITMIIAGTLSLIYVVCKIIEWTS